MDWKRLARLIRGLTEQGGPEEEPGEPLFCPTKESFRIPSGDEIIETATKAALDAGADGRDDVRFSIHVHINEDIPKGFDYDDPEDWERRCPDSMKQLKDAILAPLHKFGRDEVGSIERVKGSGPSAYVVAATVTADFGKAEVDEIETGIEGDDLVLSFNIVAPVDVGRFEYAYP